MNSKQTLKLLAPYLAVGFFWCVFSNAWLAIFAYHVQILCWYRQTPSNMARPSRNRFMLLTLPAVATGPLVYFLLPFITQTDLGSWLQKHHLSGLAFIAMIPYFGLLHPLLEQIHWAQLREYAPISHLMFAGYHMLVLHSLLTFPWLCVCFVILASASFIWQQIAKRSNSLAVPIASHVLADLGIITAAWLKA